MALASVLDQSVGYVTLIGLRGDIQYGNGKGLCAIKIDDFCAVKCQLWAEL